MPGTECCCGRCFNVFSCPDCCVCMPKWICITMTVADADDCSCCGSVTVRAAFNCYTDQYEATLTCGDLSIPITAYVSYDEENEICYWNIQSDNLNGGNPAAQVMALPKCDPVDPYGPACKSLSATFEDVSIDASAGDADCLTATISTAITQVVEVEVSNCEEECDGCDPPCVTACACFTYSEHEASTDCKSCFQVKKVCSDDGTWSVTFDGCEQTRSATVELVSDYETGSCALRLTVDDVEYEDEVITTDCGEYDITWTLEDSSSIRMKSRACGSCEGQGTVCPGCCEELQFVSGETCEEPEVTATIISDDCSAINGQSATLTLNTGGASCQVFVGTIGSFTCDTASPVSLSLSLSCDNDDSCSDGAGGYRLTVTLLNSSCDPAAAVTSISPDSVTCDPLQIDFTLPALINNPAIPAATGCDCCEYGYTIRITL